MTNTEESEENSDHHWGHFSFPTVWNSEKIENGNEKVAIVSIFGKSAYDAGGCKASAFELMLGRKIFDRDLIHPIEIDEGKKTGIEGYYDPSNQIIFLHLCGAFDSNNLITALNGMNQTLQEKGFLVAWSELKLQYARSLLFLFSISHILILSHPSHVFDVTYIHLFRTLDSIRSKYQAAIGDILRSVSGVGKDWATFGRLCAPRVLFLFSSHLLPKCVLDAIDENNRKTFYGKKDPSNASPLRNLELALEDQIYRLLRKSRVITNISANSLFALPNNQAYVYVLERSQEDTPAPVQMSNTLHELCGNKDFDRTSPFTPNKYDSVLSVSALATAKDADTLSDLVLSPIATELKRNLEHSFKVFVHQHIDLALGKGFDDNVVRHFGALHFEVPKASVWFDAANKVYEFFTTDCTIENSKPKQMLSSLKSQIETEIKFSDVRCSKALPLAIAAYRDGLPPHYTKMQHQAKLDVAMGILASHARGPMYDEYVVQLEEECKQMWLDGRVGCNTISLTGNSCHHPQHITSPDPESNLPVLTHKSGITYISYCNCGKSQGKLEDPFTPKAANYDFYKHMTETCCDRLVEVQFPTFTSSIQDAKAAKLDPNAYGVEQISNDLSHLSMRESKEPSTNTNEGSQPTGLSFTATTGLTDQISTASGTGENSESHVEQEVVITVSKEETTTQSKEKGVIRQASTTEYLPGMLHLHSPPGLLPVFSSWSLVCLGPSSLYSHNAGIANKTGFLPNTNFLLPWDVTVKIEDKDKWPAIADSMGRKGFILKNKKNKMGDMNEFNVKIFLGTEYQCIRGHRFMMAAPDRHLKASPTGLVKDTAVKIANSDMPLYFPCPCSRSGTVVNGQLMRIHVVTPKAPVNVTLNPIVQPAPDPSPKYVPQPSSSPQIKLSASAYWILRLPYVYVGDNGPHYPPDPRRPSPPMFAKLFKKCYGISQVTFDR